MFADLISGFRVLFNYNCFRKMDMTLMLATT